MNMTTPDQTEYKPEIVAIELDGTRAGMHILARKENILTKDGKIDRIAVLAAGRLPESFIQYTIIADGATVAYLTRDDKNWIATIVDEKDGKEVKSLTYGRTETKKPRRANSRVPVAIDTGSDLFSAITKLSNDLWPGMKASKRASTPKAKAETLRQQLSAREQQISNLLNLYAEKMNVTLQEAADSLGITISGKDGDKDKQAKQHGKE
jgi:hypothetical protein